jgi:hypothetical protein
MKKREGSNRAMNRKLREDGGVAAMMMIWSKYITNE